jgi:hypothetical protein
MGLSTSIPHIMNISIEIIGKTANHKNFPIAVAFVPSETVVNFSWVFLNLKAGGIPLENIAIIFTDCGKQLNSHC